MHVKCSLRLLDAVQLTDNDNNLISTPKAWAFQLACYHAIHASDHKIWELRFSAIDVPMLVPTSRSPAHRIIPRHIAMEVIPTTGGHAISYQSHRHLRPASGMMHNIALHKIIMWGDHQPGSCHIVSCHITLCEQLRPASPQGNTQISLHLASHCEGKSKAVVNTSDQIRS